MTNRYKPDPREFLTETVVVRMSEEMKELVSKYADKANVKNAWWVRQAIEEKLQREI